jgi:adenosylhomocysteine nucleosidase
VTGQPERLRLGIVAGLAAEGRIARRLGAVEIGGGLPAGARDAAERLVASGATALISFGLCGGLDPALRPGAILVPETVLDDGTLYGSDSRLTAALGGAAGVMLAFATVVAAAETKALLWRETGAVGVDLESGAVARVAAQHGLPFAVLRAVCDPAELSLPPAALAALDARGAIAITRVLASLAARPGQIPALLALARDAAAARSALIRRVRDIAGGWGLPML